MYRPVCESFLVHAYWEDVFTYLCELHYTTVTQLTPDIVRIKLMGRLCTIRFDTSAKIKLFFSNCFTIVDINIKTINNTIYNTMNWFHAFCFTSYLKYV